MPEVIWNERPELRRPVVVCAFKGWNDAGEAASAALDYMRGQFDTVDVAKIDPEEYYDFTAVRPDVRMVDGETRRIDWPAPTISAARIPGSEVDLVMLEGTEPSLRWRGFCEGIVNLARELDA